ncbi:hypothetical protein, partial [Accumulibacter sp.]|uniref:hypothetical protein n=1 Tax=Accumulibacter sp. TaxID=2053492 RepID=UPI002622CB02
DRSGQRLRKLHGSSALPLAAALAVTHSIDEAALQGVYLPALIFSAVIEVGVAALARVHVTAPQRQARRVAGQESLPANLPYRGTGLLAAPYRDGMERLLGISLRLVPHGGGLRARAPEEPRHNAKQTRKNNQPDQHGFLPKSDYSFAHTADTALHSCCVVKRPDPPVVESLLDAYSPSQ